MIASLAVAQDLAPTPPMGWSTWNHYHHDISDALVRAQADAMVASGMRDAGYVYVHIDGGWEGYRDAAGVLHPNKNFPDMKALGDYIHSKGLKFGLYTGPGPETCGGAPASYGYEAQDAKMFASWGVDYLKYDLCTFSKIMHTQAHGDKDKEIALMKDAYDKMHKDILATGRPMLYSLCQYGRDHVWQWGPQVGGNMWRTSGDINDTYIHMSLNGFGEAGLSKYARPGHWNDPDFLEVGNGGMKPDEERTQMSLWSIEAAPLIAGNDLTSMSDLTRSILLNKEVIAVDQDPLGKAGDRVWAEGPLELWSRPLKNGAVALALFNRNGSSARMTFSLDDIHWTGPAHVRDLWAHADVADFNQAKTFIVPGHGVVMLRISH